MAYVYTLYACSKLPEFWKLRNGSLSSSVQNRKGKCSLNSSVWNEKRKCLMLELERVLLAFGLVCEIEKCLGTWN
ncbi:hypothetical protein C1645_822224 [Glomus cerebriforme]|uniref:Uncharacterized protein n=1 Tax=Glomus cerebriforme TaxID=658196 RepID=A0A397SZ21_9GLOM|nr:hypothetical protein C1645_822224 [Glomus cerebriforme]